MKSFRMSRPGPTWTSLQDSYNLSWCIPHKNKGHTPTSCQTAWKQEEVVFNPSWSCKIQQRASHRPTAKREWACYLRCQASASNCKVRCNEHRIIHQDVLHSFCIAVWHPTDHSNFANTMTVATVPLWSIWILRRFKLPLTGRMFLFPLCVNSNWSAVTAALFPYLLYNHPHYVHRSGGVAFLNSPINTSSLRLSHIRSSFSDLTQQSKRISLSLWNST